MILTNNQEFARKAKHITTTAKLRPIEYYHDEIGYNYRLVNVLAAIGVAQMEKFDQILSAKKNIDTVYREQLEGIGDISFQIHKKYSNPNNWLFTFRTSKMKSLLDYLNQKGIQSRPFWTPMNQLPMYNKLQYVSCDNISDIIFKNSISIPSSSGITSAEQQIVVSEIKNFFKK